MLMEMDPFLLMRSFPTQSQCSTKPVKIMEPATMSVPDTGKRVKNIFRKPSKRSTLMVMEKSPPLNLKPSLRKENE